MNYGRRNSATNLIMLAAAMGAFSGSSWESDNLRAFSDGPIDLPKKKTPADLERIAAAQAKRERKLKRKSP